MTLIFVPADISSKDLPLHEDAALRERIFDAIESEWEDTVEMLFAVPGKASLLEDNPAFARSLPIRLPYVDPLNHLQIALLECRRAGDNDERVKRAIHLTINGIAAGLRNRLTPSDQYFQGYSG